MGYFFRGAIMTERADRGAIILAAGLGTRMKSERAKVLHEVFYRPMIAHVAGTVLQAGVTRVVCVIGHQKEAVQAALAGLPVGTAVQAEQKGTGHAVLCAQAACAGLTEILILCGDTPLLRPETLSAMLAQHRQHRPALTLMTTKVARPYGYGRILRAEDDGVAAIVEEKDATEEERLITEINAGVYLAEAAFLFSALARVDTNNSQAEMYLTDIVAIARRSGQQVQPFFHDQPQDVLGVNSRVELAQAEAILQERRNMELMRAGVTMLHPATTRVEPGCELGRDCILHGQVSIERGSSLGQGCVVEQGVVLRRCVLGERVRVGAHSVLEGCRLESGLEVPPLTRRP